MKKRIIIFIILLIVGIILILTTNKNLINLTFNLINFKLDETDEFTGDYMKLSNQTWDEMNQCIIRCPLLPRINYIAEDCIFRCEEKKNEALMKRLMEKYSSEEIGKYKELDEIKILGKKIEPLYKCVNNCGRILLEKNCVNSCLYPFDTEN